MSGWRICDVKRACVWLGRIVSGMTCMPRVAPCWAGDAGGDCIKSVRIDCCDAGEADACACACADVARARALMNNGFDDDDDDDVFAAVLRNSGLAVAVDVDADVGVENGMASTSPLPSLSYAMPRFFICVALMASTAARLRV